MKKYLIITLALACSLAVMAQEKKEEEKKKEEKKFGVKISGFVKNDMFWDSRKTVNAREGHFLLWPEPISEDPNGVDVNGQSSFNFMALQSRIRMGISGPDAFGAKTSALIEGDFFAQANANIHLFRLRHALIKLNWDHLELLTGQFWNPLFVTSCFPGTVSFNTGTPMQSFARNPQVRATYKFGGLSLVAALLSQRDITSSGPAGSSSEYLRNSGTPDMHFQVHYATANEDGLDIQAGAAVAYKTIAPRTTSTAGFAVKERIGGLTLMAYGKMKAGPITVKLQGRYGENISDLLSISGFGVTDIVDLATGEQSYAPLRNMSFWTDVHTNGNPQVGIFGGYTQNLGSSEALLLDLAGNPTVYGRGTSIQSLFRVSPRVVYNVAKLRLALEVEYTSAAYGSDWDQEYLPSSTLAADNLRILGAVYYFF